MTDTIVVIIVVAIITSVHLCVRAVDARLIHHVLIEVIHMLLTPHDVIITIQDSLLSLIELLQVLFHLQVSVEILQPLSHHGDKLHLVH